MRAFLVLVVLLSSCGGHIQVARDKSGVRFDFSQGFCKEPLAVMGISVFEDEGGNRGRTVCNLNRQSLWLHDVAEMRSWVYGTPVGRNYIPMGCLPLDPGRKYGVVVHYVAHRTVYTRFVVAPDGAVQDVGPRGSGGMM
jgi:hypothetical protein